MLDLDAIEKAFLDEENASANLITHAHAVLAELRKCRAALRSVQEGIGIDETLSQRACDAVDDALRGAK